MIFQALAIEGAYLIEQEAHKDSRGSFARVFCAEEFENEGLMAEPAQVSTSANARAGTLRGLHRQLEPHEESKLVRCTRGAIFDVIADIRPQSATYRQWFAAELDPDNGKMLYIPPGCLHGFQTLRDRTDVEYCISVPYVAGSAHGVRWDDPTLAVDWPPAPEGGRTISARDLELPLLAT